MSANPDTKLQVNLKTPGGALINVYATDETELLALMRVIYSNAQAITQTEQLLSGASVVQNTFAPAAPAAAPAAQSAAPVQTEKPAPSCKHGPMTLRHSKPGAARKWSAYMCPTPKGTPDQCEPQWID